MWFARSFSEENDENDQSNVMCMNALFTKTVKSWDH